jgi:hypothetical protein
VLDIAGPANKVDKRPADEYSPPMEIWTYNRKGDQVTLWIVGAKVVPAQGTACCRRIERQRPARQRRPLNGIAAQQTRWCAAAQSANFAAWHKSE